MVLWFFILFGDEGCSRTYQSDGNWSLRKSQLPNCSLSYKVIGSCRGNRKVLLSNRHALDDTENCFWVDGPYDSADFNPRPCSRCSICHNIDVPELPSEIEDYRLFIVWHTCLCLVREVLGQSARMKYAGCNVFSIHRLSRLRFSRSSGGILLVSVPCFGICSHLWPSTKILIYKEPF